MESAGGWGFLSEFRWTPPSTQAASWLASESLAALARRDLLVHLTEVDRALRQWDRHLEELGGDPVRHDWTTFRPLRLSREEDWSDWLAFLLERSMTGVLGAAVFGGDPTHHVTPASVRREWALPGDYRADLGIELAASNGWLHVEVKVGDEDFPKTFGECAAFRAAIGGEPVVRDFILLPSTSMSAWTEAEAAHRSHASAPAAEVVAVTWDRVAVGLRRSLRRKEESIAWRAWAHTFVGAIEQRLLGVPRLGPTVDARTQSLAALAGLAAFARVLEDGANDG